MVGGDGEKIMTNAKEIGTLIGKAIARDHIAEKMVGWVGINDQDGDQLTAAGIQPGTAAWNEAEIAAKEAYELAVAK